ncbi:hypothetical protein V9T40_010823 [Parthenolecanium corni]|uniref:Reverse transcriptase domain-containing protein n=1 Tax=Parthenolecanium corni TaxID=536013 RepID=A0AAN9T498_9HEMI
MSMRAEKLIEEIEHNNLHLSPTEHRVLSEEIATLEQCGIIKKQKSDYKNPIYLNQDPNDPYKLVLDFANTNKVMVKKESSRPSAKSLWPSFRNKKYISTLKLRKGYYQIPLPEELKVYTGFTFNTEEYVFNTLVPGMRGVENTLQKAMEERFDGMLYEKIVYLDTIYVFGETEDECVAKSASLLQQIRSRNLKICTHGSLFSRTSAEVVGVRISNNKLEMLDKEVKEIENTRSPKTLLELFAFVELARCYEDMIKGFARLAAPLTDLFEKPQPLMFTRDLKLKSKHMVCFDTLKKKLLMKPALTIFDQYADTVLYVTPSKIAIEGDLYQIDPKTNDKKLAVGFYSKKVRDNERNWDLFDLEMLAIVESCQHFQAYLKKCPFTVYSTNPPEMYENRFKEPSNRLKKLKSKVEGFSFKIRHVSKKCADGFYEFINSA